MENRQILEKLEEIISKDRIKQNEPMKKHTTFKIGGPADFFIKINTIEELKKIVKFAKEQNISITVVGNGSNLLVTDKGIRGIVIKLDLKEIEIQQKDEQNLEIIVDSGVAIGTLAQRLLKEEITGFEELASIPGTIGGAILMDAGAYGKEIKDIIDEVTTIDYNGNIKSFSNEESKFTYRNSKFSNGEYIILQTKLLLKKGNKDKIKQRMDEYSKSRKEKQPIEYPNAGSTFKRGDDFITAKLIDEAGLKGYSIGGAKISEKHAGFIINEENATAKDVLELVEYIQSKIYEKFEKKIELEVKILGEK